MRPTKNVSQLTILFVNYFIQKTKTSRLKKRSRRALPLITLASRLIRPAPHKKCFAIDDIIRQLRHTKTEKNRLKSAPTKCFEIYVLGKILISNKLNRYSP